MALMQRFVATTATELDAQLGRFVRRFSRIGTQNISVFAQRFCEVFGLHEIPRNPAIYLPTFGVKLEPATLSRGVRAVWLRAGDLYTIQYSRHQSERLGLVLWHEFFEIMSALPVFPTRLPSQIEERLATQFAVYLMMPEELVRVQAAELRHPEINKSRVLADRFGVSMAAMRLRLRELGLEHRSELARSRYL
ncbi:MAG: ImmA/IrrE family metallo-endopeptidase [Armatimonadetes bacterium]|nr:ImmA/IrrE family metallo-endopeptidase [Armatimonadota bacterium]